MHDLAYPSRYNNKKFLATPSSGNLVISARYGRKKIIDLFRQSELVRKSILRICVNTSNAILNLDLAPDTDWVLRQVVATPRTLLLQHCNSCFRSALPTLFQLTLIE